jgi:hypothetical protein
MQIITVLIVVIIFLDFKVLLWKTKHIVQTVRTDLLRIGVGQVNVLNKNAIR